MVSSKVQSFQTTIFTEMSALAAKHNAINLSQGFPEQDGEPEIINEAIKAFRGPYNQYAPLRGLPVLLEAVAQQRETQYGLKYNPESEIAIFTGATEAIYCALMSFLNPDDEVICFEPVYDSYPAAISMAGAHAKYLTLNFPNFELDEQKLLSLITPKTKVILLNSPHNPTGKVFSHEELCTIAQICVQHNLLAITDEVYENLIYDGAKHIPLAQLPGMRERTLSISSLGKTYSFTGWKIGWATGPEKLIKAALSIHQFTTFSVPGPLQIGAAYALTHHTEVHHNKLRKELSERRAQLLTILRDAGFEAHAPLGTYFMLADFGQIFSGTDVQFAHHLIEKMGVAAIPPSFFYPVNPKQAQKLLRFVFCKSEKTLTEAGQRLKILSQ